MGYSMNQFSDANGLPQNSVKAIAQDRNGFIWLTTEGGLVRFDGQSFSIYDKAKLKMPSNRVKFFLPRLNKYDEKEPQFNTEESSGFNVGIDVKSNPRPAKDNLGYLTAVIGQQFKGTVQRGYITSLPDIFANPVVDTTLVRYIDILPTGTGGYYLRNNGNIGYYEGQARQFSVYWPENRELMWLNGKLYACRKDGSLFGIDAGGGHLIKITGAILNDPDFIQKKSPIRYFWNNIHEQAFISIKDKLYCLNPLQGWEVDTYLLIKGFDLTERGIVSVYKDKFRNILMGSLTEGLYVFGKKEFQVATVPEDPLRNVFYATIATSDSTIVVRSGYRIPIACRPLSAQPIDKLSADSWSPQSITKDRQGNLWVVERVSAIDRQLSKYSPNGQRRLVSLDVPGMVNSVYCDTSGLIWFESDHNRLYVLDSNDPAMRPRLVLRVPLGEVVVYLREGSGPLWIGSSTGLYRLEVNGRKMSVISEFKGQNVRSLTGNKGELWITTYENGIYLYLKNKVTHFPVDLDRYLSSAHCMALDRHNRFWVPTNKGLFVVDRNDLLSYASGKQNFLYYHYFDKSKGFNTNEFNGGCQPCGSFPGSKHMVYPSLNGIVHFNPDSVGFQLADRGIFIKQIIVDGKETVEDGAIHVPRSFGQLQIQLSTPYFDHAKNVQISYRLQTGEEPGTWIPLIGSETIYLMGLRAGNHKLKVRKINGFGGKNYLDKDIQIIVPPYWYETLWFQSVLVLLTGILAYAFWLDRTRFLTKKMLERQQASKTRLFGDIVTAINHDIQTPLYYVIYSLEQIKDHFAKHGEPASTLSRMSVEALNSLRRIGNLTGNLLRYLQVDFIAEGQKIRTETVALYPLLAETIEMFSTKISRDGITVFNQIDIEKTCQANRQLLSVIIHNLVDNAVKAAKGGTIYIRIVDGTAYQLVITDSGRGMPEQLANWLSDSNGEIKKPIPRGEADTFSTQIGVGLVIVKDLCTLCGIRITVNVRQGEGTRIYLTLDRG